MAGRSPVVTKATRFAVSQNNPSYSEIIMTAGKVYVSALRVRVWRPYREGWLALVQHNESQIIYINMYSPTDYRLIFQHELYFRFFENVNYVQDSTLISFQSDFAIIGLNFLSDSFASAFFEQLRNASPDKKGKPGVFSLMPVGVVSWQDDAGFQNWLADEKLGPSSGFSSQELSKLYCKYETQAEHKRDHVRRGASIKRSNTEAGVVQVPSDLLPLTPVRRTTQESDTPSAKPVHVEKAPPQEPKKDVKGVPELLALANRLAARRRMAELMQQ
jgi:hypothetical protein